MLITRDGVVLRTQLAEFRETGRSTQGVTLMNLAEGDIVVGIAIMDREENSVESNGDIPAESNGNVPGEPLPQQ
jgi:DNA gyrase subunit A